MKKLIFISLSLTFLLPEVAFTKGDRRKFEACKRKIRKQNAKKIETACKKKHKKSREQGLCRMKEAMAFSKSAAGKAQFASCAKFASANSSANTKAKRQNCQKKLNLEMQQARKRFQQCLAR